MQKKLKDIFGSHHGLDERSIEFLTKALEKHNLPGFDYIEFKQSLGALIDMGMEEDMAYKSSFATASTLGLTKEKLKKSVEHYKNVLSNEKKQFNAALEKQIEQRVRAKQEEVAKLRKQVEEYQAKIQQLQEKMAKAQSTIDNADQDINSSKERIESSRENFEFTWQSIMNQISVDIENIDNYL